MNDLVWLLPTAWWGAFAVPLLLGLQWWLAQRTRRRVQAEFGARGDAVAGALRRPRLRAAAAWVSGAAVGVALLGPAVPGDRGDGGADLVVCLDVSWSMAARDVVPSRLEAACRAIDGLVGVHADSRVALVAFAGDAIVQAPLTHDVAAVAALAAELFAGGVGRAGTDPGAAIARATALLQRGGRAGAIAVVGDGEDFVGGAAAAAAAAVAAGYPVHTIGCGSTAGSKIAVPGPDGAATFLRDAAGRDVVTRRETEALAAWAVAGRGALRELADDVLRALHDDVVLPAARAAAVRAGRLAPVSLVHWPLLVAVLFWMLRRWLPERTR